MKKTTILKIVIVVLAVLLTVFAELDCVKKCALAIPSNAVNESFVEYYDMQSMEIILWTFVQMILVCANWRLGKIIGLIISFMRTLVSMSYLVMLEGLDMIGGLYKYTYSFTTWGYIVIGVSVVITTLIFVLLLQKSQRKEDYL